MARYRSILLALIIVVLTACGNGGGAEGGGGATNAPVTAPDASDATAPEPDATTPDAPGGGDGGAGADGCRYATAEEVSAAVGVEVADGTSSGDGCTYLDAEGGLLLAYVYISQGGASAFESQAPNADVVEGIGDGALWFTGGGMYILKGDAVMNMTILSNATLGEDDAALRAAAEEVARLIAGRM